jgi:hypothetical protein
MAPTDRTPVENARRDLATARHTLIDKLYAFELAGDALKEAQRKFDSQSQDLADAQEAFDTAQSQFQAARDAEAAARATLQSKLADWLPDGTTEEDDVGRLLGSEPIVLFPVRLESRFDGGFLKLRVYPDEIFLNTHETALTVPEFDAAKDYYTKLNDGTGEQALWRDMVSRFGVERSAYVLREMLPIFGEAGLTQTSSYFLSSSTCGGTLIGGKHEQLFFPQDIQFRASNWTRPGEGILPDRWLVVTYAPGTAPRTTRGNRIVEPLAMTADPKLQPADLTLVEQSGTYKIDDDLLWTLDFDRAEQVGMGIKVPLQGNEATTGYDRVIVVGVKSSMSEIDTSLMLERLFDAHHYTRGLAILRPGSPTNNTEGHPTSFPPQENAGEQSFIIERQRAPLDRQLSHHCMPFNSNGHLLGMALGVPSGVFANVDRGYFTDQCEAPAMNQALWPGTAGYYMQHMLGRTIFNDTQIASARHYFTSWVLARGPAPALRIGGTPYGVLPIASLRDWAPRNFGDTDVSTDLGVEAALLKPLKTLFDTWLDGAGSVPRIRNVQQTGASPRNPDADVATVLSTSPSAREFRVRLGHTEPVQFLIFQFFGWDYREVVDRLDQQTQTTLGRIGFPQWRPPIGRTLFYSPQPLFTGDIVAPQLSEDTGLPVDGNFIQGILGATVSDVNQGANLQKPATPNLLYTMLRHSAMTEYARVAAQLRNFLWIEFFIFDIPSLVGSGLQYIIPLLLSLDSETVKNQASELKTALQTLAFKPTAELERLFTETLDLISYRLDAWIGALPTRRLDDMRRAQVTSRLLPRGDYLGGYGWLEDVRPRTHGTEDLGGGLIVEKQDGSGGFIHTPSMTHATAAAILRNGHLSFKNENPAAYGIDLSSAQVRMGRWLFEGVRNGQPVGALLGYQLERGLHEGHPNVTGLDQLRFTLRALFPLVANKAGEDSTEAAEAIAARNVVDGSLLLRAYKDGSFKLGSGGIPAGTTSQGQALKAELDNLDRMYDAAADLLTAESVFQLARGNIDAAVPTINNVVEGNQPPDTIITRSARGGAGLAHRVALVFPSNARPTLPSQFGAVRTPRGSADQDLNAWLGELIGNPDLVTASLSYLKENGDVINSVTIKLTDLHLDPLDLLALAEVVAKSNQGSVLDLRIISVGLNDPARQPTSAPASFKIDYETTTGRTFTEVLEVLGTAAAVISAGRALEIKDLLPPVEVAAGTQEPEAEPVGGTNAKAFYLRGEHARGDLTGARDALGGGTGVRAGLLQASFIVPMSAFPDPHVLDAALADQASAVLAELDRRIAALPPVIGAAALDTTSSADLIANGHQTMAAVFGPEFRALPDVDPPRFTEIQQALDARATLVAGDDAAPDKYLQRVAHARPRVGKWRKLNLSSRVFGRARPRVDIVQLPFVPGEKWLGVGFDVPDDPNPEQLQNLPTEGRTGVLLLSYAASLDPSITWRALMVDDWTEVIPNQVEETGIAMHFDSPQSQAPQAVLVATPSKASGNWTFSQLLASLEQTMDLMKIRAVSNEFLDMGQTLPMAIIPGNEGVNFALSTLIESLRVGVDTKGLSDG